MLELLRTCVGGVLNTCYPSVWGNVARTVVIAGGITAPVWWWHRA